MESPHADYVFFRSRRHRGFVLAAHAAALEETLINRVGCLPLPGAGRGGLYQFTSPLGPAFLRVYRRGGAIRHFVAESYVLDNRPLAEFRVHTALADARIPVPKLLGVVWHKVGPIYRGAIATLALSGSTLLQALRGNAPPPTPETLRACGALIRRLHDAGVYHADLNASNLFLSTDGPQLLDFDRAAISAVPLSPRLRRANLERLQRSLRKHGVPPEAYALLVGGYEASE